MKLTAAEIKDLCSAGVTLRFRPDGTLLSASASGQNSKDEPMTPAQRAKRYRESKKADSSHGKVTIEPEASRKVTPSRKLHDVAPAPKQQTVEVLELDGFELESDADSPDPRHREITSRIGEVFESVTERKFSFSPKFAKSLQRFLSGWKGDAEEFLDTYRDVIECSQDPYAGLCRKCVDPAVLCQNWMAALAEIQKTKQPR